MAVSGIDFLTGAANPLRSAGQPTGHSTMSDLDRNYASPFGRAAGRIDAATVDAGLRAYMLRIYNYMTIGLAITGLAALGVYMAAVTTDPAGDAIRVGKIYLTPFGYQMFVGPLKWVFMLAPLAMVFVISAGINRLRPATAQMLFWAFSALMGISLSSIFLVYTHTSIVRVFFITAATFGALSLYGYTTKRDMSGMGSFLIMGLFGIIIASLVNIFLASSMLQFVVSVVGVLVFAGLTAWDTQRLKNDYIYGYASQGGDVAERAAITGALSLYLNFINLFTLLLQLLGLRGGVFSFAERKNNLAAIPSPEISPASTADLPAITEIYEHAVRYGTATFELIPPDLAEMTRRFGVLMDGGFPYLVATLEGRVVGYAYAGAYRPRPAYRFTVENSVYLQPAIHRRGIGMQLLLRLIAESEQRGYRQMIAVIGDSANAGSIGVHTRCGFQMIGTHPSVGFKFGRWLDTVMMQRALGDGAKTLPRTT